RIRIKSQEAESLRAPQRLRQRLGDLVIRERREAVKRILENRGDAAEITVLDCHRWHRSERSLLLAAIVVLPAHEEERFIAANRPAEHDPVLITMKSRLLRREEVLSI